MKLSDLIISLGLHPPIKLKIISSTLDADSGTMTFNCTVDDESESAPQQITPKKISPLYSSGLLTEKWKKYWLNELPSSFDSASSPYPSLDTWLYAYKKGLTPDHVPLKYLPAPLCDCGHEQRLHDIFYDPSGDAVPRCIECDCSIDHRSTQTVEMWVTGA